jgi:hypothetical protein
MQTDNIFLWGHPRSLSTATEVYFRASGDFQVIHEPFVSCYWEDADPIVTKQAFLSEVSQANLPVFAKDIAHHAALDVIGSAEIAHTFKHAFILRSPLASFHSHLAVNPEVKSHEFGYIALYNLFDRLRDLTQKTPKLILADQIFEDPETTIKDFCDALEIKHIPEALSWQPKQQSDWAVGDVWQAKAGQSKGFEKRKRTKLPPVPDKLLDVFAEHQRFYMRLIEETCIEEV